MGARGCPNNGRSNLHGEVQELNCLEVRHVSANMPSRVEFYERLVSELVAQYGRPVTVVNDDILALGNPLESLEQPGQRRISPYTLSARDGR